MSSVVTLPFDFGDKVHIDDDATLTATVIGFAIYPHGQQVQCAWFANGAHQEAWLADWRLSQAE